MIRSLVQVALLSLLVAGCGRDVTVAENLPDRLDGTSVARMAERQLEAENPGIAPGTLSCPTLEFRVGAAVRCVRVAHLSGGRMVEVAGTVQVTSRRSGGHLHVAMDERAREFGVTGAELGTGVREQFRRRFGVDPRKVRCPYLRGEVGARVTCRVQAGGAWRDVDVVVTAVDAASYRTTYEVRRRGSG